MLKCLDRTVFNFYQNGHHYYWKYCSFGYQNQIPYSGMVTPVILLEILVKSTCYISEPTGTRRLISISIYFMHWA